MKVSALTGPALESALDDVARLRIAVFKDWPYLYDGDMAFEQRYLEAYQVSDDSLIVGAYDGDWLVGASTGAPLVDHASDFAEAFSDADIDITSVFYFAESVLLPSYRGRGIGKRFFDIRENHALARGFPRACFCSVIRPDDHPLRPANYRPLDGFWRSRGYAPLEGVVASFKWKDVDQDQETLKTLQFWTRDLQNS